MLRVLSACLICLLLSAAPALAQCGPGGCPSGNCPPSFGGGYSPIISPQQPSGRQIYGEGTRQPTDKQRPSITPKAFFADPSIEAYLQKAVCVVRTRGEKGGSAGSGTVICVWSTNEGKRHGIVLTCNHVMAANLTSVSVEFTNKFVGQGKLLGVNTSEDLAAIDCELPGDVGVVPLADEDFVAAGNVVGVCGFEGGKLSNKHITTGTLLGYRQAEGAKADQMYLRGNSPAGASGSGIFNKYGELVGVLWGSGNNETYGSYNATVRSFVVSLKSKVDWIDVEAYTCPLESEAPRGFRKIFRGPLHSLFGRRTPMVPVTPPPGGSGVQVEVGPPATAPANGEMPPLPGEEPPVAETPEAPATEVPPPAEVPPPRDELAEALKQFTTTADDIDKRLSKIIEALEAQKANPPQLEIKVDADQFVPPTYVDVSLLWALQRKSGISHMIVVGDSRDPSWTKVKAAYAQAKAKFSAIGLLDVQAKNIKVAPLPQLVVYLTDKQKQPQIVKGESSVLQQLAVIGGNK